MLRTFRKTNPDIAYLYLMRRVGEKVVFVIDSDETSTQAMPGQEYKQRIQSLMEGFLWPSVDKEIYTSVGSLCPDMLPSGTVKEDTSSGSTCGPRR
jgi:hypothetical protein